MLSVCAIPPGNSAGILVLVVEVPVAGLKRDFGNFAAQSVLALAKPGRPSASCAPFFDPDRWPQARISKRELRRARAHEPKAESQRRRGGQGTPKPVGGALPLSMEAF